MSEPTVSQPGAPPKKDAGKGGKKKVLGLPVPVVIAGGAAVVALAWLWWRGRSKKGTASTSSTTSSSSVGTDYSSQLAELQSEIDELMANEGGGGGGGSGTTPTPPGTTPPGGSKPARPVTGTKTSAITDHGADLSWADLPSATSYRLTVKQGGSDIHNNVQSGRSFQLTGLKPGTSYTWEVAGVNSAGQGPYSAPVMFRTHGASVNPGGVIQTGGTGPTRNPN